MKLLKRTADEAGKKVVLITSDPSVLPLAGAVKIHVAKTLQSKPAIPAPPDVSKEKEVVTDDGDDKKVDKNKSVGELAGVAAVAAVAKDDVDEETIDVDTIDDEPAPKSKSKSKKNKLKVPNFDSFRKRMFLIAGIAALLLTLFLIANKILPKATVTIKTNSTEINASVTFTANKDQASLDVEKSLVPAEVKETETTSTQKVPASGKKNVGEKASGTMTVVNCSSAAQSLPAGTTFTNGVVSFVSDEAVSVPKSGYSFTPGGFVCDKDGTASVDVTATQSGAKYNVAAGSYSTSISNVTGTGSAMSGGTDKTVTVVSQADIDSAKQKASQDTDKAKAELSEKFKEDNLYPLPATLQPGKQTVTSSAKVGEEANEVSVDVTTKYTMLGVKQSDIEKLIDEFAKDQIDIEKQKISDYGLDEATISISSTKSPTNQTMSLQTSATAGASIDEEALKGQIKGMKGGDVKILISQQPGVEDVTVDFSPFWVNRVPSNPSKVTIVVEKQQVSDTDADQNQ